MRRRFADEDILRILGAGDSGLKVADLCAAEHITPRTYYHWKVKYGDLTPEEMKQRRLRERMYRHAAAAVAILVALGAVYVGVGDFGGGQEQPARTAPGPSSVPRPASRPPARPPAAAATARPAAPAPATTPAVAPAPATRQPTVPAPAATQPSAPASAAATQPAVSPTGETPLPDDVMAIDPDGSAIQVAAVALLADARKARDQLIGSGYPAYVTRVINAQGEVYRVRVGPLASRAAAEEVARRLEGDGHGKVWIVK